MNAIITAGGTNRPGDPLLTLTGIEKKALIPLAGKPMVLWVTEALYGSGLVDQIIIVGLEPGEADFGGLPVTLVKPAGGMIDNVLAAMAKAAQINPAAKKLLVASSDIPLISPEIVRNFVNECGTQDGDLYYAVVEEKTMETRFPGSNRTFVPFKGGRYSGGDIFLTDVSVPGKTDLGLIRSLTGSRKNYWNQARLLGFGFIVRFVLRMMTVYEAAKRAENIVNLDVRVVDTRHAELGMDLDKPHQYEMIKAMLEARENRQTVAG